MGRKQTAMTTLYGNIVKSAYDKISRNNEWKGLNYQQRLGKLMCETGISSVTILKYVKEMNLAM